MGKEGGKSTIKIHAELQVKHAAYIWMGSLRAPCMEHGY